MTKRVRWDGPGPVAIFDSEAPVYNPPLVANLEPGQLLPLETDQGDPMPARIRDEFAHNENTDWTEVGEPKKRAAKKADADTLAEDKAAVEKTVALAEQALETAKASNDSQQIAEAASNLKAATEALESLTASTDADGSPDDDKKGDA